LVGDNLRLFDNELFDVIVEWNLFDDAPDDKSWLDFVVEIDVRMFGDVKFIL
jgi:hypothetical protein